MGEPEVVSTPIRRFNDPAKNEKLGDEASRLRTRLVELVARIQAIGNTLHGPRAAPSQLDEQKDGGSLKERIRQAHRVLDRCGDELTAIEGGL